MLELAGEKRRLIRALSAAGAVALLSSRSLSAASATAAPSQAATSTDASRVWYRGSEGCPDGAAFIGLLRRLGRATSLARVGDRVDFVVTVAHAGHESSGRLERQSNEGTVAIREVVAASCEEVAEVLALSLDLALQPGGEPQPSSSSAPPLSAGEGWEQGVGAHGTLETGLARALIPGVALFIEVGPVPLAWSLRLSLRGAYAEPDAAVALDIGLLGARAEACWAWAVAEVALGPCGGVEVGLVFAESSGDNGRSDVGLWSGALAHGRGGWQVSRRFALEAQVGLLVPFVRYRFSAETGAEVSSSAPLGLETALGFSFRF